MKIINFFNCAHNGDLHISREYAKDLINILNPDKIYYHHFNNSSLMKDLNSEFVQFVRHPNNIFIPFFNDNIGINIDTWIGQNREILNRYSGCNFPSLYNVMSHIYESLNIKHLMKDIEYYIPSINYEEYEIEKAKNYFENNKDKKFILVCNNDVRSGQASNFNMNKLIEMICDTYKDYIIIATNNMETVINKENFIFADDIIGETSSGSNLNEISYISTKTSLIIGRSSGPYSFTLVKENYKNNKFICLCGSYEYAWYSNTGEDITWSDNYDENNIMNLISKKI